MQCAGQRAVGDAALTSLTALFAQLVITPLPLAFPLAQLPPRQLADNKALSHSSRPSAFSSARPASQPTSQLHKCGAAASTARERRGALKVIAKVTTPGHTTPPPPFFPPFPLISVSLPLRRLITRTRRLAAAAADQESTSPHKYTHQEKEKKEKMQNNLLIIRP